MRKEKRWRYYCDFCGKSGGHPWHMKNHESSCTANPERKCRMCEYAGGGHGLSMKELIDVLGLGGEDGLKRLREATENCPACMLAAIRQSRINEYEHDEDGIHPIIPNSKQVVFNFKNEMQSFWNDVNQARDW